MAKIEKIHPLAFYTEWKGHPITDLKRFLSNTLQLRSTCDPIIWLAGDSSLDNKAWIPADGPGGTPLPVSIPDIYTRQFRTLTPMKPDVAFWMNHFLGERGTVINGAVEASLLRERVNKGAGGVGNLLLPHDRFVKDNIREQDVLVVSVGANDIVLSPTMCTAFHMMRIAYLAGQKAIEQGTAGGLVHFRNMFGRQVQEYIKQLTAKTKPRAVLVCMIYHPLESGRDLPAYTEDSKDSGKHSGQGWADTQLHALKYDTHPDKLQAAIRTIYAQATCKIAVEGTTIIPVPLFEVLDGTRSEEYVERVEPSVEGGRRMGERLIRDVVRILEDERQGKEKREDSVVKSADNREQAGTRCRCS